MGKTTKEKKWSIAHLGELEPQECSCGTTRRAFTEDPDQIASVHLLDIKEEAKTHFHKEMTEIYLVLEGEGHMELDGERIPVQPLDAIMIKPGCKHRAIGDLRIVNIPIPAFVPDDEWYPN